MGQANVIAYNVGAFISALFLLEFGADKFIAHTSAVAARIQVSEVIIGLLTAGAEWEEVSARLLYFSSDIS
jgi:Ca2+/Na+ antiporter